MPLDLFIVAVVALAAVCIFVYEHTPVGRGTDRLLRGDAPAVDLDIDLSDIDWPFQDREMVA